MRERDEVIQRRGRELVELVARRLPMDVDVTEDGGWPAAASALVCRMTATMVSILDLQKSERESEAGTLARSLYEHAVYFAWLAADPPRHIEEWRKDDLNARLKADREMTERGIPLLGDATRAAFKQDEATMQGKRLNIADLAIIADAYWAGRLPGMGAQTTLLSFRGMYASLYRLYSGMAHPTVRGLNRAYDDIGGTLRRVRLEGPYEGNGPYGLATFVFALALYASGQSIGWPSEQDVTGVFVRHPDPRAS